jgi:hypothetical protein
VNLKIQRLALAAVAPLAIFSAAAQHGDKAQHGDAAAPETITLDAQGGDYPEWFQNPHMVEFYALSVAMLKASAGPVDAPAYELKAYAIFRAFAASMGADPDGMVDHLKAIPREMVGIVAADPQVLDSYENFLVALRGPR